MEIAEVVQTKQGTVVIGAVACDRLDWDDSVRIVGGSFEQVATVGDVQRFGKTGPATLGDRVGILLVTARPREQLPLLAGMRIYLASSTRRE